MQRRTSLICSAILTACALLAPSVSSALTFSPTRLFVTVAPGEEKKFSFEVHNETARDAVASVEVRSFTNSKEAGVPQFTESEPVTSLKKFILLSASEVRFAPDERKTYSFSVRVPANTKPGSYFGAIHLSFAAMDGGVGTMAVTGPLVFLTVSGEVEARLALTSAEMLGGIQTSLPQSASVLIRNDGQTVEVPDGEVRILNVFNGVSRVYALNQSEAALLPNDERAFLIGEEGGQSSGLVRELNNFGFGPYTWEVRVKGSQAPEIVHEGGRFWVVPWRLMALALGVSFVLALVLGFLFPRKNLSHV